MIYKRGEVYWYRFKWSLKHPDGKRDTFVIRNSSRTSNRKKAVTAYEQHRDALREGKIHPLDPWPKAATPAAPSFREFVSQFTQFVGVHNKSGTVRFYGECVARLLNHAPLADAKLTAINSEIASKYAMRRLSVSENSPVTVNGDLRTLRRMLNLAEEWGLIPRAPKIHELPGATGRDRIVSQKEEAAYLKVATRTLRDLAILAADSGLRPDSELFPLEWANVRLQGTQEAPAGVICVPAGKTSNAVRAVRLTPRSREVLLARRELCGMKGLGKYVFPGEGKKGHIVTVQHAHERAVKNAGLPSFPFYCWRHTFGTRCAESGMDRYSLARLMGHSSPSITAKYYIHVTESHVSTGFDKFLEYQAKHAIDSFKTLTDATQ
jgi:integrase